MMMRMLLTSAMKATPSRAPGMLPLPPVRLAPPRMTAVITRSSAPARRRRDRGPYPGREGQAGQAGHQAHHGEAQDLHPLDLDAREPLRPGIAPDVIVLPHQSCVAEPEVRDGREDQEEPDRGLQPDSSDWPSLVKPAGRFAMLGPAMRMARPWKMPRVPSVAISALTRAWATSSPFRNPPDPPAAPRRPPRPRPASRGRPSTTRRPRRRATSATRPTGRTRRRS